MGRWGSRWQELPQKRTGAGRPVQVSQRRLSQLGKPQLHPRPSGTSRQKAARRNNLAIYFTSLDVVTEYRFATPRRWRFDVALPQYKVAVEQEGGLFVQGRHNRAKGYIADMAKYNEAVQRGWRVLRFTPQQIKDGTAFDAVHRLLNTVVPSGFKP